MLVRLRIIVWQSISSLLNGSLLRDERAMDHCLCIRNKLSKLCLSMATVLLVLPIHCVLCYQSHIEQQA